jgi:hypothetical protein
MRTLWTERAQPQVDLSEQCRIELGRAGSSVGALAGLQRQMYKRSDHCPSSSERKPALAMKGNVFHV